jgi:elongation factor 1-beta
MIFAAFVSHEARVHGREIALNTQMPFDEAQVINEHKSFLFEHMEKQIHEIKVYAKTDKAIESIPGGAEAAAGSVPSKPVCLFAESTPSIPEESTQPKGKGDKGGAGGKGGKGDKGGKGGKGGDGDKGGKGGKQEAGKPKGAPAAGGKKPNPAFDQIEGQLANSIWIGGQNPTQADNVAFESMKNPPDADANPVAFGWYNLCRQFTPEVRGSWPAGAAPSGGKGEKGGKGDKGGKLGKQSTKKEEDDIDDLFASDDEEETKAAAEALKKKGEDAKKKGAKPKPVARSLVIWEVKPWGPETDLDALGKKILAEVKMDGLVWKSEFKKEPVAYGVFKIVIGATVEDEKVSTDDVQEAIEAFDDFVQSVDILAFNKL